MLGIVMLSGTVLTIAVLRRFIMLGCFIMLNVGSLSVIMLIVVTLIAIMLSDVMLSIIMLSIIMLSDILMSMGMLIASNLSIVKLKMS
jgi:hypothetical protein